MALRIVEQRNRHYGRNHSVLCIKATNAMGEGRALLKLSVAQVCATSYAVEQMMVSCPLGILYKCAIAI